MRVQGPGEGWNKEGSGTRRGLDQEGSRDQERIGPRRGPRFCNSTQNNKTQVDTSVLGVDHGLTAAVTATNLHL